MCSTLIIKYICYPQSFPLLSRRFIDYDKEFWQPKSVYQANEITGSVDQFFLTMFLCSTHYLKRNIALFYLSDKKFNTVEVLQR